MTEAVKSLPFWDRLSRDEKALCEQSAVINEFNSGSYLTGSCGDGDCLGMIHVISGEIRVYITSEEGREITLFRIREGENCVLSASCVLSQITFDTQLFVTRDAKILLIPSSVYERLMESNIHVRCFSYELATERFSSVMWVMQQILFHGFDRRLAGFFISEYERTGDVHIRMTQENIAAAANSAREVVARMIKQFASDGLIETGRGMIILKNIEGLKDLL